MLSNDRFDHFNGWDDLYVSQEILCQKCKKNLQMHTEHFFLEPIASAPTLGVSFFLPFTPERYQAEKKLILS